MACLSSFLLIGCSSSSASFVSTRQIQFQNVLYVGTDESVDNVGAKLGTIKTYSTKETDANPESFSNYYPKGTNLYAIPNVSSKEAIAVQINTDKYIEAVKSK